jgi:RNA polymerase sigma factor (sigma-70 family)
LLSEDEGETGAGMAVARAAAGGGATAAGHARVEAMVRDHGATLRWIARRWSGTPDEAEDALQRALEIYLRRLDTVDPATELAWLKVVVRHEAMAVRRARIEGIPLDAPDVAERVPAPDVAVQERIEREERIERSREALAQLKPDERTALLLKAEGFSYREIAARQNWTYTKVNRAITEGRRRFLSVFAGIEAGEECERFAPTLLALVQGGAASADVLALRPHLRHCAACRATVRELHASRLHRLALHLPFVAGIAPARWLGDRVVDGSAPRGLDLKALAHGALNRFTGSDAATGVQLASTGGGGRGTAVAALVSLCLGSGAGTYCLATGGLPDPVGLVHRAEQPDPPPEKKEPTRRRAERPAPTATPVAVPSPRPVATIAAPASQPTQPRARPRKTRRTEPTDPQHEFGFESATADPSGATAAPAPSAATATTSDSSPPPRSTPSSSPPPTSGGEFLP